MEDINNPNPPRPPGSPTDPVYRPTEAITQTPPLEPVYPQQAVVNPDNLFTTDQGQLPVQPRRKRNKKWLILLLMLIIAGIAGAYYYSKHQKAAPATTTAPAAASPSFANSKPEYAQDDSVAGYLSYDPTKFKEVSTVGLPNVKAADPNVNVVIMSANVVSYGESGLYLYDLGTNKSYKLTSGGGSPRIMSDHYLLYGFDEKIDGKQMLGAKLLDLNSGVEKVIFSAAPTDVPGNVCCSVSPDGLRAILPQKDKVGIFDIRKNVVTNYPTTLAPVADGSVTNTSFVEMSYASPVWVDNDNIIYADKPATKTVMIAGAATKPAVDTNLFSMDLTTGKSTEIVTGASGIYDIFNRGAVNLVDELTIDTKINQFSKLASSQATKLDVIAPTGNSFYMLSQKGDKLYLFPALYKGGGATVVDTNTKVSTPFNPAPTDIASISQIIPKGWAGEDRIIIQILDTATATNHEYIGIYNTTSAKVEQYTKIN